MLQDMEVFVSGNKEHFDSFVTNIRVAANSSGCSLSTILSNNGIECTNPLFDRLNCNSLLFLAALFGVEVSAEEIASVGDSIITGAIVRNGTLTIYLRGNENAMNFCKSVIDRSTMLDGCGASFDEDGGGIIDGEFYHLVISGDNRSLLKVINIVSSNIFEPGTGTPSIFPNKISFRDLTKSFSSSISVNILGFALCDRESLPILAKTRKSGAIQAWSASVNGAIGIQCAGADYRDLKVLAKALVDHSGLVNSVNIVDVDGNVKFSYVTGGIVHEEDQDLDSLDSF